MSTQVQSPAKTLQIRTSPHILSGYGVDSIMFNVVLALMPASIFGAYAFGLAGLLTQVVAVVACVLTEHIICRLNGERSTVGDWSAAVTGMIYGLTLPPSLPLWMVGVGGILSIGLGKALFGGLGANPFNPALVGRAILQAAFPVAMTSWMPAFIENRFSWLPPSTLTFPFTKPEYDGFTGATPLSMWKFDRALSDVSELAVGLVSGSTGETSGALLLLGGVYLIARNMMNWRIPISILLSVFAMSGALHLLDSAQFPPPLFMLMSGGLILGAMFMATDMVGSPMTGLGCWIYGAIIGLMTVAIRIWGGMPEGVMYAILFANALVPHIDNLVRPVVYGTRRVKEMA